MSIALGVTIGKAGGRYARMPAANESYRKEVEGD